MDEKIRDALLRSRLFVERGKIDSEQAHDDPDGDLYMDFNQWSIMQEADALMELIDSLLG